MPNIRERERIVSLVVYGVSFTWVVLYICGLFFPGSRNWGFHFLAFLPYTWIVIYVAWIVVTAMIIVSGNSERFVSRLAVFLDTKPIAFFAVTLFCYACCAFIFRVNAPLLGDGSKFIKNYTDFFGGEAPLAPWHEPLSIYFFYLALSFFGHASFNEIMRTFFITDLLLGGIFLFVTFQIVRRLFAEAKSRLLAFVFLIVLPYSNVFFGYVEVYALTLTALAVFVHLSILVIDQKISFALLCLYGVVLTYLNSLNGFLWLSIGYLALLEYGRGNKKSIIIGFCLGVLAAVGGLIIVDFDLSRLTDVSPVSHFLSMTSDVSIFNDYSQAFTLFSFNHLIEVTNYVILMSPFAVVLIVLAVSMRPGLATSSPVNVFLMIITFSFAIVMTVLKIEQGMACDWDVLASYFYFLGLFGALLVFSIPGISIVPAFFLIVSLTTIHSFVWYRLNSTIEPNIRRIESLFDTRSISQLGHYMISLNIARYYDSQGDTVRQAGIWDSYGGLYPLDPRGYANRIASLKVRKSPNDTAILAIYEEWSRVDLYNDDLKREYASYCTEIGNKEFASPGRLAHAGMLYRRAIELEPNSPVTLNNLGSVYAEQGKIDSAIFFFKRAIEVDSTFSDAYYDLGWAYSDQKDERRSLAAMKQAARLGNIRAKEYLRVRGIHEEK